MTADALKSPIPVDVLRSIGFLPLATGSMQLDVYCLNADNQEMQSLIETYHSACHPSYIVVGLDELNRLFDRHGLLQKREIPLTPLETLADLVRGGLQRQASDIHLVARESCIAVLFRCDGHLLPFKDLDKQYGLQLINAVKVRALMDVAEGRQPQSGSFRNTSDGTKYEIRVSTHPTLFGESTVLRLLTKSPYQQKLEDLGFSAPILKQLQSAGKSPAGLIVLTGPTGSGKTTTLYSLLHQMDLAEKNVMTLEQPIEYFMPSIRQTEIREGAGMSFASGIRSILRQDPDVILIGEIRDSETAAMALRAAMTGHLVLTTVHTRDAWGVISRLEELGVPRHHIQEFITIIVAQRLIRKLCQHCRQKVQTPETLVNLGQAMKVKLPGSTYQSTGCSACFNTGYQGRFAVGDILTRQAILAVGAKETPTSIREERPFLKEGLEKVAEGQTDFAEVFQQLGMDLDKMKGGRPLC